MKISHKSKKYLPPHPQVAALIADTLASPTNELAKVLAPIDSWKWPRSDLNAWINVLNKFDAVLEDVIREFEVDKLQANAFSPDRKEIVLQILKFERLLLENSTNRKMFNSYDRLNSLLFTSDLDVLVATLLLLLRPSQQYSSQPALSHALHISTSRLESLAKNSPMLREHGVEMLDLVSKKGGKRLQDLPQEASEVNFTFYRKGEEHAENPKEGEDDAAFESSSRQQPAGQSSAPHIVHMGPLAQSSRSAMQIFADAVKSHQVPDSDKYELFCRVRTAHALGAEREDAREKLVIARLLAISVYGHTHSETQAQSSLFLYDTDLVNRIAELLQQDREVPIMVQMAAISALDALARYRGKISEVLGAVNAGVNHGILMSLFRKTVSDISSAESILPNLYVDALLSFITYIASHQGGGNMVVGAGLVPLLIQIIGITHEERLPIVSKTMQLIDNVLYGFMVAFTMFCNNRGVEALTDRIKFEADLAIENYASDPAARSASSSYGLMQFTRAGVLKHLLRSIHRMMQSSGTTEGMRGLIDSSLLKSVQKIIEYRGVFGPTVLPIAINVVATFVHNEPTSLTAIQEAKLPETIFKTLEAGIEPSFEVIQSIPNVLGALCLNQAGQDQLALHPSIIPALFSIFTSEAHFKVLIEKENAVSIGSSIDELIRHHPLMRNAVFDSLISTLKKIEDLGKAYVPPTDIRHFYLLGLNPEQTPAPSEDVEMDDAQVLPTTVGQTTTPQVEDAAPQTDDALAKSHDNVTINYIDAIGRFLEGLFQHPSHCRDFIIMTEGLTCLSRLLALPCLPYDYANAVHSDSLVQVVRTMVDVAPQETLEHLAKHVNESLDETKEFWQSPDGGSKLLRYVDIQDEDELSRANSFFHKLVTLHVRITLLSDVYSTAGYSHGRHAIAMLQDSTVNIVPNLGALHRSCIWENIVLKNDLVSKGITTSNTSTSTENTSTPSLALGAALSSAGGASSDGAQPGTLPKDNQKGVEGPKDRNAVALKHIASQIPNTLGPFFQALAKMLLYSRRSPDEAQKKQAASLSATLADVMYKHLTEFTSGDATVSYAYHTVMVGLITFLLFDERATQANHHAVLLLQFRKVGGLDAVLRTCRRYMDAISRISELKASDRSESDQQELVHVFGGLKMVLHLLFLMISFRPSVDPGQVAQFISGNKPETHPDYYEPHDFLVKMRLEISPVLRDIWQSSWLVSAPPGVSKYIIQCVQEIVTGDGEVPRQDFSSEMLPSSGQGLLRPSQAPDEDRIRQLTDMGFPRASALRALSRTNNNVSFATEYLLAHPFELVPEEAAVEQPAAAENERPEGPAPNEGQTESIMETEETPAEQSAQENPPAEAFVSQKTAEERRQDLDTIRNSFISDIGPLALRLADAQPSLIFDVRHVLIGQNDKYQPEAIRCVVNDIERFSPAAYDVHEEPLAVRCRLLALILADSPNAALEVAGKEEKNLMDMLHALLLSQPIGLDKDQPMPKWLPALLLAMESLLVTADEPRAVPMVLADQAVELPPLLVGTAYTEARSTLFELCIRLLHIPTLPRDELLATLRMLIQLTRDRNMASQFVHRDGVSLLLHRLKEPSKDASVSGFQSHIAIILRHLVEDKAVLASVMKQEIKRWLSVSRSKTLEILTYVRNSTPIAARDPQVFLDVTKEMCVLVRPDVPNHQITLRSSSADTTEKPAAEESNVMQIDSPSSNGPPASSEILESVVHYMLGELIRVGKVASEGLLAEIAKAESPRGGASASSPPSTAQVVSASEKKEASEPASGSPQELDDVQKSQNAHYYASFLMQSLSELLFSYEQCKIAFLTYPKKRNQTPAKDMFSRSKSTALNFLLTEFVTFGPFNIEPKADSRKRVILCNWAMSVIVALCVDGSVAQETVSNAPDVTSIRKLVLESINRSLKDVLSGEPVDIRYGRILALSDLCHRLLSVRFGSGSTKAIEETPMQLAKIMLEKNFVATLTSVLADVDLNYPNIRNLIAAVLRPLEYLTKVSMKMGRSDKSKEGADKQNPSSNSVSSDEEEDEENEDEDMDTEDREETPDLYRNSSLGMYSGEMEEPDYDEEEDDEMDEDEDEEDEDVDVEFDEGSGSEDSSNTEPEDEIDEEVISGEIGNPQDGWVGVHEDIVDNGDEMDDDDDEGDDVEADGIDEEIMWQPPHVDGEAGGGLMADDVDDDDLDDGELIDGDGRAADDDDAEIFSTADGLGELGELEHADQFTDGMEDPFGTGRAGNRGMRLSSRLFFGGGGADIQGRDLSSDMHIIGRPRHPAMSAETMLHPLLVDTSNTGTPTNGQTRSSQNRRARGVIPNNPYAEVLHTIEELVGGGAMQLVQELMNRSGLGGTLGADIRVEVPQGAGGLLVDRAQLNRHGRTTFSTSVRLRDPRSGDNRTDGPEFGPLQTIQRWTEEAKITHGKHLQDRIQRLCNHIVLSLLPEAREEAQKTKEKEEKERAEREKEAAERAAKEAEEKAAREAEERAAKEAEEKEAAEIEEAERAEREAAERAAPPADNVNDTSTSQLLDTIAAHEDVKADEDTEMADATVTAESVPGTSETRDQSSADVAGEGTSTEAERITVTVNGNVVDITDTGIDPEFLMALPDDMREEVLNQHFREQRTTQAEQPAESQISAEFLDALPPEIRAEILREERLERSRRERGQNGEDQGTQPAIAADMGAADFIASLDPQLRQVVLLDSDDGILQTLPSHMVAEAGGYREGMHHIRHRPRESVPPSGSAASGPRKVTSARDAIQLLDRTGIAALVRLLFFPQLSKKTILHKVLLNLCENSKSRTELFNVLLSILQDGTGDLALVDKSFSQLSFRGGKGSAHVSAKNVGKQKEPSLSMVSPIVPSEVPPDLVAQRCLDALTFIVGTNELSSLFFLTEHELPAGLKRSVSKKGKGKEKQAAQSHYPIVLLLGLMDRQNLLKTPSIMDSIATLLDAVTRPLTSLKDQSKKKEESGEQSSVPVETSNQQDAPNAQVVSAVTTSGTSSDRPEASAAQSTEPVANQASSVESVEEKILLANPPQIPHHALRSIVNILTVGECSGRTFQHTLTLIQHLSFLPDARDVIAQELRLRAHEFGVNLSADLDLLIAALQSDETQDDLPPSIVAKFSPASSDQAKLLRVLKTIDYMYSKADSSDSSPDERLREIYETFRFTPLWRKLGECLTVVESKANVEHIATILLPLIESLMVVCKNVGIKASSSLTVPGSPRSPHPSEQSVDDLFVSFTDDHRKILNLMVRNNPSLMSGSFSLLVKNPRVLDFDNKRNYFSQQVHKRPHPREHYSSLQVNVRRSRVFEDSFHAFQHKNGDQIKFGKLSVRFYAEEGVDAGGVTREWFQILARQMFNPNYALFEPCAADRQTYQPNRASEINPDHLSYFKFVGRVIGKAIYDGRLMDAHFARSLYRMLLGKRVDYRDVEWVDPDYYKSLCWILENDPTALDLTFITEVDEFGEHAVIPLKENGTSIPVTMENRKEYVQLAAQYRLHDSIAKQIENLLAGFYEIIPKELIAIFNEQEVELLISGTPDIDVDEWRAATEYHGYSSSDPAIVWWWRALKSFNRDERAKVLSFATGTTRVPLGGFTELQGVQGVQRFSIHRAYGEPNRLPQAHTCFNQIDLPEYSSYEKLRQQLLLAINEGGEGFGFA